VNRCPGCGWPHPDTDRLKQAVRAAETYPDALALWPDHMVAALYRWNGGRSEVIAAEWQRRRSTYTRLPRWFR
jgi:hypothetical protein